MGMVPARGASSLPRDAATPAHVQQLSIDPKVSLTQQIGCHLDLMPPLSFNLHTEIYNLHVNNRSVPFSSFCKDRGPQY